MIKKEVFVLLIRRVKMSDILIIIFVVVFLIVLLIKPITKIIAKTWHKTYFEEISNIKDEGDKE
jgi:hypothetical protein